MLEEDNYTKLTKKQGLKIYGYDSNQNIYVKTKKGWKKQIQPALRKNGKCIQREKLSKITASPRIKIKQKVELQNTKFYTFDVETKDGLKGKELFCWSLASPQQGSETKYLIVRGKEYLGKLFDYLAIQKEKWKNMTEKVIFVHNLSFDIRFIIEECIKREINYFPVLSGSSFVACFLRESNIKFVDTLQFLKTSQEKAEKEWGIESQYTKAQTDALMTELFRNKKYKEKLKPFGKWTQLEKETLVAHCDNDVIALHKIMKKFRQTMANIAQVDILQHITISSLAMAAMRITLTKETEILNPFLLYSKKVDPNTGKSRITYKIDHKKEKFVRKSYYGGRNELLILKRMIELLYIDAVSMFSDAMKDHYYPSGVPKWLGKYDKEKKILEDIIKEKDKRLGFIEAIVEKGTATTIYPTIPKRLDDRVMFMDLKIKGVYTTIELQYAAKMGNKITPIQGLIYPSKTKYFNEFVDKFFPIKQNNVGGRKHSGKIMLNGGYGKFGQEFIRKSFDVQTFITQEEMLNYMYDLDSSYKSFTIYNAEYRLWMLMTPIESITKKKFMNVGIASFVTSYARIKLLKMMHLCEKHNILVHYVDTDSFTISKKDYERLRKIKSVKEQKIFHKKLGGWDIEQDFKEVEFIAPKCYISLVIDENKESKTYNQLIPHLKMKGVAKSKINEILKEIEKAYQKDKTINRLDMLKDMLKEPIEEAERYMTFKQAMRAGHILATKKLVKHYTLENFKRNFNEETGLSEPWNIKTLPEKFREEYDESLL